jgi:hypothetical protein
MCQDSCETSVVDVGNVYYVDSVGPNFLFRGALPLSGSEPPYTFNYCGLKAAIKKAAPDWATIPDSYRIVDINLLHWGDANEVPMITAELNFFAANPDLGEFLSWETTGTTLCPLTEPLSNQAVRDYLALNLAGWLGYDLHNRVEVLRFLLEASESPTVIYAHCRGGDDRTGELIGAYYLRWLNMSWADMNARNEKCAGRVFGCNNYRATLWYCIYLVLRYQYILDYTQAFMCYNGSNNAVYECQSSPDKEG